MMLAFIFYIISFAVFYAASSYWLLGAAMLFYAMGDAFRSGVHKAMIFTYLQLHGWTDQKVHYYGLTRSWSQRGSAVSSLLAALVVIFSRNYTSVFLLSIIPYLLDMALIWSYPKALDGAQVDWRNSRELRAQINKIWRAFVTTFRHPPVLRAVNNISLLEGYFQAVKDYLQPILQSLALSLPFLLPMTDESRSAILIGVIYFLIYLLTAWASQSAGRVSERFSDLRSPINWNLLIGLLLGVGAGWFYQWELGLLSVGLFILLYLINNLQKPMGTAFFAGQVETDILASALSAQSQVKTIWAAVIAMALGGAIDIFGVAGGLWMVSAGLVLLLPVLWIRR
jgi:hypothetical protein